MKKQNNTQRIAPSALQTASQDFRNFFEQFKVAFVDRDEVIDMIMYAMIMRQHIMLFGPPGTAKTALCDAVFDNVSGAKTFKVELSRFMSDDSLFGPYNMEKMRQDGTLEHVTDGMLPEADLARLGEFLDGSEPTLRTLLGALNEREFRRGRQVMDMPLMTAYADTNRNPQDVLKTNPMLWALLDRILFMTNQDYLDNSDHISEMIRRFQTGQTLKVKSKLPLEQIHILSEPIVMPPSIIQNSMIFVELGRALHEYRERRRVEIKEGNIEDHILPDISDRRLCFATQMPEVEAVLQGRLEVQAKDLLSCHYVLGTTFAERRIWEYVVGDSIERIKEFESSQVNVAQQTAIEGILEQSENHVSLDHLSASSDLQDFRDAFGVIKRLEEQLDGIVPQDVQVGELKEKAQEKLRSLQGEVDHLARNAMGQ